MSVYLHARVSRGMRARMCGHAWVCLRLYLRHHNISIPPTKAGLTDQCGDARS
jgi:hypothetical protein